MPKTLGRRSTPSTAIVVKAPRPKTASRGYGAKWNGFSRSLRREVGICQRCEQLGRTRVCDLVDHKMPIASGGSIWDRDNLWCLCSPCHDGFKRALEDYARKTDQTHMLRFWCDSPEELPRRFQEAGAGFAEIT